MHFQSLQRSRQDILVRELRGQRFVTTLTNTSTVPTPELRRGKFTFNGQPIDVSASSLANCPNDNNVFCLPLDPTIQSILALYPPPNCY